MAALMKTAEAEPLPVGGVGGLAGFRPWGAKGGTRTHCDDFITDEKASKVIVGVEGVHYG